MTTILSLSQLRQLYDTYLESAALVRAIELRANKSQALD